ncbi:L,D-transpeptidase [Bauldia sp.]|uniref:L,D-transpeptidase n=1 Tax=Bauldia sp. TaxID=2575872 RepID=UPI003BA993EA
MAVLAGCSTATETKDGKPIDPLIVSMYAPVPGEPFRIPAVPVSKVDSQYFRQTVATPGHIPNEPGVIVVDPYSHFLYLVQDDGQSLRYGIGVGRQGFSWSGTAEVHDKQHWPKWFPPKEMQERDRFAARFPNGMNGGPRNPLGSRALYLWKDNKDTLYRIHATNEPLSIGKSVSSGCIRMWNQDVMDLYERVPLGTKVVVLDGPGTQPLDAPLAPGAPAVASAAPIPEDAG